MPIFYLTAFRSNVVFFYFKNVFVLYYRLSAVISMMICLWFDCLFYILVVFLCLSFCSFNYFLIYLLLLQFSFIFLAVCPAPYYFNSDDEIAHNNVASASDCSRKCRSCMSKKFCPFSIKQIFLGHALKLPISAKS